MKSPAGHPVVFLLTSPKRDPLPPGTSDMRHAQEASRPTEVTPGRALERRAVAFELLLERHKLLVLGALTVLYFGIVILRAHGKPFWYDEILTILEARQPTISAAMQAGHDADWMPPVSHLPFYLANKLVGSGEVAFRLPSMIGFWVYCLCLFCFVARRASISFAFMAMLLPFSTTFWSYSFEARSYALMLGFCGVALLCWQLAADGAWRALSLPGLALSLAGAFLHHYWAVFVYLPLAGAEAYRSVRLRKIDWPIWVAFIAGGIPLVVSMTGALHVIQANPHPWSIAHSLDYVLFYQRNFQPAAAFVIPLLILLAACLFLRAFDQRPAGSGHSVRDYEWLAAALFVSIPIFAITAALIVPPHAFVDRYLAPVSGGFALLIAFLAAHFSRRRAAIGMACMIASLPPLLLRVVHVQRFRDPFQQANGLRQALGMQSGRVVISDTGSFVQLWYYAPENLKARMLGLADEQSAVKYLNIDDIPNEPWRELGVPIFPYHQFTASAKRFLIYYVNRGWITNKVHDDGGGLYLLGRPGPDAALMLARIP
jgi:hypothetical protein